MLDLARHDEKGPVLLKDIAARQQVSKKYLEHIMTPLRDGGLVIATRGASGGYRLARPASGIDLADVFEVLEGEIAPVDCVLDAEGCSRAEECVVRELWCEVADAIRDCLAGRTLADLSKELDKRLG
jgi:Rrf2 family protein